MSAREPGRAERLILVLDRDGNSLRLVPAAPSTGWCGRPPSTSSRKLKGGPSWVENEVAACRRCNSDRGSPRTRGVARGVPRRGWEPDERRLTRALTALAAAIARQGGQRRARPYLDGQLRPVRRVVSAA